MKFNIETFLAISDPITKSIWEYFKTHIYNILWRPIVVTSDYSRDVYIFHRDVYLPWPAGGQYYMYIMGTLSNRRKLYTDLYWTWKGTIHK